MNNKSARHAVFLSILTLLLAACVPQTAVPIAATAFPTIATDIPLSQPSPSATTPPTKPPPSATIEAEMPEDQTGQSQNDPNRQLAVQGWIDQATVDLAQRTSLPVEGIELIAFELKEWSDSSLGCPQPGMMYAQVLQEGYLIRLQAGDQVYTYHCGRGAPFLCEQKVPPVEITKQPPLTLKGTPTISIPPPRD